jgi:hypothetical protein
MRRALWRMCDDASTVENMTVITRMRALCRMCGHAVGDEVTATRSGSFIGSVVCILAMSKHICC